jgi:hypothetical protein
VSRRDVAVILLAGERIRGLGQDVGIFHDELFEGGVYEYFGIDISEYRVDATDLGWSYESGHVLRAEAADLALVICGRTVPDARVEGEPLGRLPWAG